MSRPRGIVRAVLIGLGLLLVLWLGAAFLVPRLIDPEALRDQITTRLSSELRAEVRCDRLRLTLLPLPHAVLDGLSLSKPETADLRVASVSVSPRLLPLLHGKLEVAAIRLHAPDVTLHRLPAPAPAEASPPENPAEALHSVAAAALGAVAALEASPLRGVVVRVRDGRAEVPAAKGPPLMLEQINARLGVPPEQLTLELQAESSLWKHLSVRLRVDPKTVEGGGRIHVVGLQPQLAQAWLRPGGLQFDGSEVDLDAHLTADGAHRINAAIDGSFPTLTLRRDSEEAVLRGARVAATVNVSGRATDVRLDDLRLDHPRMRLSGRLSVAPGAATLELRGTDVDVESTRTVATAVAGKVPVLSKVFAVLRSGTVPEITVRSQATSLGGLGEKDALAIRGRLVEGGVNVPGVDLDLTRVSGDASVAGGFLTGEQLSAQLAHSTASGGKLRLGLSGKVHELHVETPVKADAAEVAAVLKSLIHNASFQRGIDRLSDVSGALTGRLVLGGTTKHMTVTAEATAFDLAGRLRGVAAPLHLEGGSFLYDQGRIEARQVRLTAGASSLGDFSAHIEPGQGSASFEATAGESRIVLGEVYPWVTGSGWLPASAPQSLSGTVALKSLRISGPLEKPADWHVEMLGSAQGFAIESKGLQERIAVEYSVALSDVRLQYDAGEGVSFAGKVVAPGKLTGAVDLAWSAERLNIKSLQVRDQESDATLALLLTPRDVDLKFTGHIHKATVDALLENDLLGGFVQGDARARIFFDQPARSKVDGKLEVSDLRIPMPGGKPLRVRRLALQAAMGTIGVQARLAAGHDDFVLKGEVKQEPQAFVADLALTADHVDWADIRPFFSGHGSPERASGAPGRERILRGTVRVAASSFSYDRFTWQGVRGVVEIGGREITLRVTDADVCHVATPGTITVAPQGITLAFQPVAKNLPMDRLVRCLGVEKETVTGQCEISGSITAHGRPADLRKALRGHLALDAVHGRLYGFTLTARLLSVLGLATGAVWNLEDVSGKGLPYDRLIIKSDVKGSTLVLTEAVLDGPTVKWAAEGSVDLASSTLDLTFLVAPLKTADSVVSRIPLVNTILGGSLVTVPIQVTGKLGDPKVSPLPAAAVGEGLAGVLTRTLNLPRTVIRPLLPKNGKQ